MGRNRKHVTNNGNVKKPSEFTDHERPRQDEKVEERLGLNDLVCTACEVKNPSDADKCRKCGCTQLRERSKQFRDE